MDAIFKDYSTIYFASNFKKCINTFRGQINIIILYLQTANFEANQAHPWSLDDAPVEYIQALCRAIVGIRVDITAVQAQFKLSQNKTAENRVGVIAGLKELRTTKANEMAALIEKVNKDSFNYE